MRFCECLGAVIPRSKWTFQLLYFAFYLLYLFRMTSMPNLTLLPLSPLFHLSKPRLEHIRHRCWVGVPVAKRVFVSVPTGLVTGPLQLINFF